MWAYSEDEIDWLDDKTLTNDKKRIIETARMNKIQKQYYAIDLFHRVMLNEYGHDWPKTCKPHKIMEMAVEVAHGFGAKPITPQANSGIPTLWVLSDGSYIKTSHEGLEVVKDF
jgi:hypothetical protein